MTLTHNSTHLLTQFAFRGWLVPRQARRVRHWKFEALHGLDVGGWGACTTYPEGEISIEHQELNCAVKFAEENHSIFFCVK